MKHRRSHCLCWRPRRLFGACHDSAHAEIWTGYPSFSVGAELGGLGAGYEIWSANARVNWLFRQSNSKLISADWGEGAPISRLREIGDLSGPPTQTCAPRLQAMMPSCERDWNATAQSCASVGRSVDRERMPHWRHGSLSEIATTACRFIWHGTRRSLRLCASTGSSC